MSDDERRDEEAAQQAGAEEQPRAEAEEPIEGPEFGAGPPPPDTTVFDMLRAAIGLFAQEAWIALGLQPRYGSNETKLDLRYAKVAIDTTQILVEQLGEEADAEEKREFERILTDLRVNFMRRKAKAGGEMR